MQTQAEACVCVCVCVIMKWNQKCTHVVTCGGFSSGRLRWRRLRHIRPRWAPTLKWAQSIWLAAAISISSCATVGTANTGCSIDRSQPTATAIATACSCVVHRRWIETGTGRCEGGSIGATAATAVGTISAHAQIGRRNNYFRFGYGRRTARLEMAQRLRWCHMRVDRDTHDWLTEWQCVHVSVTNQFIKIHLLTTSCFHLLDEMFLVCTFVFLGPATERSHTVCCP